MRESGDEEQQADNTTPIIYDEIMVQPLSTAPSATDSPSVLTAAPLKPPNRRSRWVTTQVLKAIVKGNWKWPRGYREAMEAEDA